MTVRLLSGALGVTLGGDVDVEGHSQGFGEAVKGGERGFVVAGLQAGDCRLLHAELSGECCLGEVVLDVRADIPAGQRRAWVSWPTMEARSGLARPRDNRPAASAL